MAENRACGSTTVRGLWRGVKILLLSFVFAAAYNIASARFKTAAAPAASAAAAAQQVRPAPTPAAGIRAAAKTAVVYYFYTNTRCSSCKAIEAYTKEAVDKNFSAGYKGWKVTFKGVNVDEEPDKHFAAYYRLTSKSVVVQKFSGDKALSWGKLEKVWQLLGEKSAFIAYVTGETRRLLDEK
ncbi:MAG: nitrophenyl compound nitroreductase subunit ArsF family protein [Elusimicrobia bacterium]|nr:nitrophenyl compound nitroreductase subunit ArsF family protein [Elusimicrobiota bacterium]